MTMRNYLSFGGGVNSVAMMLYILDEGWDFEAVFVNHGTDWPETYEYLDMFQEWLDKRGVKPVTVLTPKYYRKKINKNYSNLYNYSYDFKMVPSMMSRWCTRLFKIVTIENYIQKPCFMLLGFDIGEINRADWSCTNGVENRFPLIEAEINRAGCTEIIKSHGLLVPQKSGCYICPYQSVYQWKELRHKHPDLFCKAEQLEKINMEYRKSVGKKPLFLNQSPKASLRAVVNENQNKLFVQDKYPPCYCML